MDKSIVNMINLYIINEKSRAAIYGIGTYIRELLIALKDSNIAIYVVNLHSEKPNNEQKDKEGIQNLYFPSPLNWETSLDRNTLSDFYYRNVVYLLQLHITNRENLVFHLNNNKCCELVNSLRKTFVCKIIAVTHYSEWGFIIYGNINQLRDVLKKKQSNDFNKSLKKSVEDEISFYIKVDHIICLSKNMYEILSMDYGIESSKITIIPNGLTDSKTTIACRKSLYQKWHISSREKIVFFAGRMDEIKGLSYLIKAFRQLLNSYPKCRLVIAGNGSFDIYMKECEDIWMHITWTGMVSKDKLYDLYAIADIGVMPSFHEQCSYVAIEMMMHGMPLIASTSTGLKEMVTDGVTGLHIPVIAHPDSVEIDTDLLAEKMLYLLQHPAEAKAMGRNGRKRYLKEYTSEIFRRNMLDFYQSLFTIDFHV